MADHILILYDSQPKREPRYKRMSINPDDMLCMLQGWKSRSLISIPTFPTLPADAEIESVVWDEFSRSFALRVWSSEFPVHTCGLEIDRIDHQREYVCVNLDGNIADRYGVQMAKLSPKPNDIIVLKVDAPGNSDMMERAKAAAISIRERHPNNTVVVLPEGCDMVLEDEKTGAIEMTTRAYPKYFEGKVMPYHMDSRCRYRCLDCKSEAIVSPVYITDAGYKASDISCAKCGWSEKLDRFLNDDIVNHSTPPNEVTEKTSVNPEVLATKPVQFREWL